MKTSFALFNSVKKILCVVYTHTQKQENICSDILEVIQTCSLEVLSMEVFNKISDYKTQTFMWNIEKWKMRNSGLISKQNAEILPMKS